MGRGPRPYAGIRVSRRGIRPYAGIGCLLLVAALVALPTMAGLAIAHAA